MGIIGVGIIAGIIGIGLLSNKRKRKAKYGIKTFLKKFWRKDKQNTKQSNIPIGSPAGAATIHLHVNIFSKKSQQTTSRSSPHIQVETRKKKI